MSIFEIWSATPTPLDETLRLDKESLRRLIRHHLALPIKGLLLAGNCGEGPCLTDEDKRELVRISVSEAAGGLQISVQVTDNSALRILKNIDRARADGADMAVIAEPYYLRNATPSNLLKLYEEVLSRSSLPVCIYHLGKNAPTPLDEEIIKAIYAREEVVMIKDSSSDPGRQKIALESRRQRPEIRLLNGDEFLCMEYAQAGYDGVLFGGAIFNAEFAAAILKAVSGNDISRATRLNEAIKELNCIVYGNNIEYWLFGLKYLLVKLGIISTWENILNYLPDENCKASIDKAIREGRFSVS